MAARKLNIRNIMLMKKGKGENLMGEMISPITMAESVKVPIVTSNPTKYSMQSITNFIDVKDRVYNPTYFFIPEILGNVIDLTKSYLIDPVASSDVCAIKIYHKPESTTKNIKAFYCFGGTINNINTANDISFASGNTVVSGSNGYRVDAIDLSSVVEIREKLPSSTKSCMIYSVIHGPESDEVLAMSIDYYKNLILLVKRDSQIKLVVINKTKIVEHDWQHMLPTVLTSADHKKYNTEPSLLFNASVDLSGIVTGTVVYENKVYFRTYDDVGGGEGYAIQYSSTEIDSSTVYKTLVGSICWAVRSNGDIHSYNSNWHGLKMQQNFYNPLNSGVSIRISDLLLGTNSSTGLYTKVAGYGASVECVDLGHFNEPNVYKYKITPSLSSDKNNNLTVKDIHLFQSEKYTVNRHNMREFDLKTVVVQPTTGSTMEYINPDLPKKMSTGIPNGLNKNNSFRGITISSGNMNFIHKLPMEIVENFKAVICQTRNSDGFVVVTSIAGTEERDDICTEYYEFPCNMNLSLDKRTKIITSEGIKSVYTTNFKIPGVSRKSKVDITFDSASLSKLESLGMLEYVEEGEDEIHFYSNNIGSQPISVNARIRIKFNN